MKSKATRRIATKIKDLPEVALNSPLNIEKGLPFPFVYYPNHYGTFISFSALENSERFFCSCAESSVRNCLELKGHINEQGMIKSSWGFHHDFCNYYCGQTTDAVNFDQIFSFKAGLCHQCNNQTPRMRWCHEMYGSNFRQYYGWYIGQTRYGLGFKGKNFLEGKCPPEISGKLIPYAEINALELMDDDVEYIIYQKTMKELDVMVENLARKTFGFRAIGDGWVNETALHGMVCKLFSGREIIRHFRPSFLENLELDIFCPELNLALEYQGQQHFIPIKAWGGQKALDRLKQRDSLKRELCLKHGIYLVEISYQDPLTVDFLKDKLSTFL